jgi:hypothetical protein
MAPSFFKGNIRGAGGGNNVLQAIANKRLDMVNRVHIVGVGAGIVQ